MQQRQPPPARTFTAQGPTLGELSDAYLQDYQVRQFRSQSTARSRIAHLVACFGRAARAAALTTYQIRQYQLARRAAGAATGTINRETSALHRALLHESSLARTMRRGGHRHHQSRDLGR